MAARPRHIKGRLITAFLVSFGYANECACMGRLCRTELMAAMAAMNFAGLSVIFSPPVKAEYRAKKLA
jgi:hypothetical protein